MVFYSFIIISSKIKEDMEKEWITWVQYLPIKLEQIDNSNNFIEWYYVLNILNREKEYAIDSNLSRMGLNLYLWVWFYKDKLFGYDIFRIDWKEEFNIFISEKIKKKL